MNTDTIHATELSFMRANVRGDVGRLLVLRLTTAEPMSADEAQAALEEGLSQWAQTTPEGRQAWDFSSEDYNVGDLCDDLGNEDLLRLLKEEGILAIAVAYELNQDPISYDHVLISGVED